MGYVSACDNKVMQQGYVREVDPQGAWTDGDWGHAPVFTPQSDVSTCLCETYGKRIRNCACGRIRGLASINAIARRRLWVWLHFNGRDDNAWSQYDRLCEEFGPRPAHEDGSGYPVDGWDVVTKKEPS